MERPVRGLTSIFVTREFVNFEWDNRFFNWPHRSLAPFS